MTHTSTEQPEALRLAEFFESMQKSSHRWYDGTPVHEKAAAELRRLHARVQELEAELAALSAQIRQPAMTAQESRAMFEAEMKKSPAYKTELMKWVDGRYELDAMESAYQGFMMGIEAAQAQRVTPEIAKHVNALTEIARMPNSEYVADAQNNAVRYLRGITQEKQG